MTIRDATFLEAARAAGFTQEQGEFLLNGLSQKPHTHTADQIEDFDEAVNDAVDDRDESDDTEDDDEDDE